MRLLYPTCLLASGAYVLMHDGLQKCIPRKPGTHKSSLESRKAHVFIAPVPFVCEARTMPTRSRAESSCCAVRVVVCRPYSPDGRLWSLIHELTVKSQPALCSNQQLTQLIFTPFVSTHSRRKISLSPESFFFISQSCLRFSINGNPIFKMVITVLLYNCGSKNG